jgi:hypothetical protein
MRSSVRDLTSSATGITLVGHNNPLWRAATALSRLTCTSIVGIFNDWRIIQ